MKICQNLSCNRPSVKTIRVGNNSVRHPCQACIEKKTPSVLSKKKAGV